MELDGKKLLKLRLKRGYSQSSLAEGICTQATISIMENKNKIPKMKILEAICVRLNTHIEDVLVSSTQDLDQLFDRIEILLVKNNVSSAKRLLDTVSIDKINNKLYQKRYYYALAMIQLLTRNVNDSIYNFSLVLTEIAANNDDIYLALSTAGMAEAYAIIGNNGQARALADRATSLSSNQSLTGTNFQYKIMCNLLAHLYLTLNEPSQSITASQKGIALCRQTESIFLLDDYYFLISRAQQQKRQYIVAKKTMKVAKGVAIAIDDTNLVQKIDSLE